jgi:hypothetical protein
MFHTISFRAPKTGADNTRPPQTHSHAVSFGNSKNPSATSGVPQSSPEDLNNPDKFQKMLTHLKTDYKGFIRDEMMVDGKLRPEGEVILNLFANPRKSSEHQKKAIEYAKNNLIFRVLNENAGSAQRQRPILEELRRIATGSKSKL